jgi:hypothetical protein
METIERRGAAAPRRGALLAVLGIAALWANVHAAAWQQVMAGGFGDPNNREITALTGFQGWLYAGTSNLDAQMFSHGGELWRSPDGSQWQPVFRAGNGNALNHSVSALAQFNGYLIAGMANAVEGCSVLLSPDGEQWETVAQGGFGNPANSEILCLFAFNGWLYAGVLNAAAGGGIQRSSDGFNWRQVADRGFGKPANAAVMSLAGFQGRVYAGTLSTTGPPELYRSDDGGSWSRVATTGLGRPEDRAITALLGLPDRLLAFTAGGSGAGIYRSTNGESWQEVEPPGFGDTRNQAILQVGTYQGQPVALTMNPEQGAEVWILPSASDEWFPLARLGVSSPANSGAAAMSEFGSGLYVGTLNETAGAEILRLPQMDPVLLELTHDRHRYGRNDRLLIELQYLNRGTPLSVALVTVLDLGPGFSPRYYFGPGWTESFDATEMQLPSRTTGRSTIFDVTLPAVPDLGPIFLYAAFLDAGRTILLSPIESFPFYLVGR